MAGRRAAPVLVNGGAPNVFSALFRYSPNPSGPSPRENFLTEALVYVIATNPTCHAAFLHCISNGSISNGAITSIDTQFAVRGAESHSYPDIVMKGDSNGPFSLWIEVKRDSALSIGQLRNYSDLLRASDAATRHLAFLSGKRSDVVAARDLFGKVRHHTFSAVAWSTVFDCLRGHCNGHLTEEFVTHLRHEGLGSVEPVTLKEARAFQMESSTQRSAHPFLRKLQTLCSAAQDRLPSEIVDRLAERGPHTREGKVFLLTEDWRFSVGVLFNGERDHYACFIDPRKPLDICVRLQTNPQKCSIKNVREKFASVALNLSQVGYDCDVVGSDWRANDHTVILGHLRSGFPFECDTGEQQVEALTAIFRQAFEAIYDGGPTESLVAKLPN